MALVSFLLLLLVAGVVVWAIKWFLDMLTLPENIKTLVLVIIAIIALVWLLAQVGVGLPGTVLVK